MATPIPCALCDQVADSDFLITIRPEGPAHLDFATMGACLDCFVKLALTFMAEADEPAAESGPGPAQPLEGAAVPAEEAWEDPEPPKAPKRRQRGQEAAENGHQETSQETEAAHVDG